MSDVRPATAADAARFRSFKPGDWVRVVKPAALPGYGPGWVAEMDAFDGGVFSVARVDHPFGFMHAWVELHGVAYTFHAEWLEPAPTPSVYAADPPGLPFAGTTIPLIIDWAELTKPEPVHQHLGLFSAPPAHEKVVKALRRVWRTCYGCGAVADGALPGEGNPLGWLIDADGRRWCGETCWAEWSLGQEAGPILERRTGRRLPKANPTPQAGWSAPSRLSRAAAWLPFIFGWALAGAAGTVVAGYLVGPW